jgi:hypothetical protein
MKQVYPHSHTSAINKKLSTISLFEHAQVFLRGVRICRFKHVCIAKMQNALQSDDPSVTHYNIEISYNIILKVQ